jgi:hypothetical protein
MKSYDLISFIRPLLLVLLTIMPAYGVVITEIMPRPSAGGEWLELYNETERLVNLNGWRLSDATGDSCVLGRANVVILPQEYLVVLADSTTLELLAINPSIFKIVPNGWVRLNDDGDYIRLTDDSGKVVDEVEYVAEAGNVAGRSWERINPELSGISLFNWGPCADPAGHTAGKANSLQPVKVSKAGVRVDPNPFNPFQGGVVVISFRLPTPVSRVSLSIFNSAGRRVRQLVSNLPAGTREPMLYWDGRDDNNRLLPIGRYIIYLEALDNRTGKIYQAKCTVVVADNL